MSTQKEAFHSLLFQAGNGVDDEKLLSALSEMLDAVEEDGSLSPFHSLPSTELLAYPKSSASAEVGCIAAKLALTLTSVSAMLQKLLSPLHRDHHLVADQDPRQ